MYGKDYLSTTEADAFEQSVKNSFSALSKEAKKVINTRYKPPLLSVPSAVNPLAGEAAFNRQQGQSMGMSQSPLSRLFSGLGG